MLPNWFLRVVQTITPQHLLSRACGWLAENGPHWLYRTYTRWFIAHHRVDMSEAKQSDFTQFRNFNEFFTRQLKRGIRPVVAGSSQFACPVDASISQMGQVDDGSLIQAKGVEFTVFELLGDAAMAADFESAHYTTLYLAPRDYHRVHMPITGKLQQMLYIPGHLFSVSDRSAEYIQPLFTRNERVVCLFETDQGPLVMVLVGAMVVASIVTSWAGVVAPGAGGVLQQWSYQDKCIMVQKGEELGHFRLGSTVIMLVQNPNFKWNQQLKLGDHMQYGCLLGEIHGN